MKPRIQTSSDKFWTDESGHQIPFNRVTQTEKFIERSVGKIHKEALKVRDILTKFKENVSKLCEEAYQKDMKSKGVDPSDKKGGYTMYCFDRSVKVERAVHGKPVYDEATLTAAKIKFDQYMAENLTGGEDFIKDMIIDAFESRNGQIDKNRINKLISYKTRSKNKLFIDACNLLSTAARYPSSAIYYRVWALNEEGKYENIELQFSAI